jgi:enoyl-CoA hydratase/carnithine racemase
MSGADVVTADPGADTLYEVSDAIATITLNRPDKMNTLGGSMLTLLSEYLLAAEKDKNVRVIILTGAGRAFCAGLDVVGAQRRTGSQNGGDAALSDRPAPASVTLNVKTSPPTVLFNLEKPTICAMNGAAAGYGMDMALGCDIRVMAQSAKFAPTPVKRGIVPESGGTWLLPRLVGWERAAEIFFTGANLNADEAKALGLCAHVVPDAELMPFARQLAAAIAANAPLAVQSAKRLMRMGLSQQFNDHVHHVYMNFLQLMKTEDAKEGMTSFAQKRPAEFKGR